MNKEYKGFFRNFSENFRVLKLRFLAFPGGPGGFRELREAGRNHFHLSWYLLVPGITSYGQKPWGEFFRSSPVDCAAKLLPQRRHIGDAEVTNYSQTPWGGNFVYRLRYLIIFSYFFLGFAIKP